MKTDKKIPYLRNAGRIILAIAAAVILLLTSVPQMVDADAYAHPSYDVMVNSTAGEINLRSGAGTGYGVLTTVPNGTVLHITDMAYNMPDQFFYGYTYYGGYTGWVSLRQTMVLYGNGYTPIDFYVTAAADAGSINFHTYAALTAPVITDIWNGTGFRITDIAYNPGDGFFWGYTVYNGMSGWISLRQTNFRRDYGNTPMYSLPQPAPEPATVIPEPATVIPEPATVTPEPQTVTPEPQTREPETAVSEVEQIIADHRQKNPEPDMPAGEQSDDPSNGVFCLYNNRNGEQIDHYSGNGYSFAGYRNVGSRIAFTAVSVGQPGDYPSMNDWPHYAVIWGYDENGNRIWDVTTDEICTLNGGYAAIGSSEKAFYYTDNHAVYALDLNTGKLLWMNEDAGKMDVGDGGFRAKAVGKEGELYICATTGGGFLAVDASGRTLTVRGGAMPMRTYITDITYDGDTSTVYLENDEGEKLQVTVKRR